MNRLLKILIYALAATCFITWASAVLATLIVKFR